MTLFTFMRLVDDHAPRLALRLALAWIASYAALHDLAAANADPRDLPPPFF